MSTEIYYFSGTGNSLLVAKKLKRLIVDAELIPVVSLLNHKVVRSTGETVGFVFPVHLMTVPLPVRLFLNTLDLSSAQYVFAVVTRGGTKHRAFNYIDKVLKKSGRKLDAHFTMNFVDNNPRFEKWKTPTAEQMTQIQSQTMTDLDLIQKVIANRRESREKDVNFTQQFGLLLDKLSPLFTFIAETSDPKDDFYANFKCSGCGICEEVCLSGKIKMINDEPIWQKNVACFACRACLNFCPVQSVQLKSQRFVKSFTEQNGRYFHPFASAEEIAEQKPLN